MDTINEYHQLIKRLLLFYGELINRHRTPEQDIEVVIDEERGHYLLLHIGWSGKIRERHIILYVRLRDGKFWIEEDGLEQGIATDLLEAGVPHEDIVLAFHHPKVRPYTEFAVS